MLPDPDCPKAGPRAALWANHQPEATSRFVKEAISEEWFHLGHALALRDRWEAAGKPGDFDKFFAAENRKVLGDITKSVAKHSGRNRTEVEAGLLASARLYFGEAVPAVNSETTWANLLPVLMKADSHNDVAFVTELLRQMENIARRNNITETGFAGMLGRLRQWVQAALNALRKLATHISDKKLGSEILAMSEAIAKKLSEIDSPGIKATPPVLDQIQARRGDDSRTLALRSQAITPADEAAAMADAEKDFDALPPNAQSRLRRVAAKQFAAVERLYAAILRAHDEEGKPLPAPNGQPSKLNRRQWIRVRTPLFKRWFGDWETLAKVEAFSGIPPFISTVKELNGLHGPSLIKKASEIHSGFKGAFTMPDGRKIRITGRGFKEIRQHAADERILHIAADLKTLLGRSLPLWSEPNTDAKYENVIAFHHYGTRATVNGRYSYVRFVIREDNNGQIHYDHDATSVEVVSVDENGKPAVLPTRKPNPGEDAAGLAKNRLAQWISSVNPDSVSKVIDENGEPMVVYHGTTNQFNEFKDNTVPTFPRFFFTPDKEYAAKYGSTVLPLFLDVKKAGKTNTELTALETTTSGRVQLWGALKNLDGIISFPPEGNREIVVRRANQIKSATANEGMFSQGNVILHSQAAPKGIGLSREAVAAQVAREYGIRESAAFRVVGGIAVDTEAGTRLSKPSPAEEAQDAAWRKQVADHFDGKRNPREMLHVGHVPQVLKAVGLSDAEMLMAPGVLDKVTGGKHSLSREAVLRLPEALRDPIMVFDSATVPDAVTVLSEITHEGRNVLAAIHLARPAPNRPANVIVSLYDKGAPAIQSWIREGLLRYSHQQKTRQYFRSARLQLPREGSKAGNKNLLTEEDVVKAADEGIRYSQAPSPLAYQAGTQYRPRNIVEGFMSPDFAYRILNNTKVPQGSKVIASTIYERKIKGWHSLFRITIIESKTGSRGSHVETATDEMGTGMGAVTSFREINPGDFEYTPALKPVRDAARKLWDDFHADERLNAVQGSFGFSRTGDAARWEARSIFDQQGNLLRIELNADNLAFGRIRFAP